MQPDTTISSANTSQSFNRYSYVSNNPFKLIDPTGHDDEEPGGDVPDLSGIIQSMGDTLSDLTSSISDAFTSVSNFVNNLAGEGLNVATGFVANAAGTSINAGNWSALAGSGMQNPALPLDFAGGGLSTAKSMNSVPFAVTSDVYGNSYGIPAYEYIQAYVFGSIDNRKGSTWGTTVGLFAEWASGNAPAIRFYGPESGRTQDLRNYVGTSVARYEFNNSCGFSDYSEGNPFTRTYKFSSFTGPIGPIEAGLNPTAQFVGSYDISIYSHLDSQTQTVIIENTTSRSSFFYHWTPESWDAPAGHIMGNSTQIYWWTEPLHTAGYDRPELHLDLGAIMRMGP